MIPRLQYVLRASPAYLCREELGIFDWAHFDFLERERDERVVGRGTCVLCIQALFPVSFGGFGWRRYRLAFFSCLYKLCGRISELVDFFSIMNITENSGI